ncbi:MAG: zinc metallopeptidase [Eggerthellaceae bacterium]|nr:zinc metallopeptidase [Eggerthellaceae bacterium]
MTGRVLINYGVRDFNMNQCEQDQCFFNPNDNSISPSLSFYRGTKISDQLVACHEVGNACKYMKKYEIIAFLNSLAPTANTVSNVWDILIIVGIILQITVMIWVGVGLYALVVMFSLVILSTEFNASRRAVKYMKESTLKKNKEIAGSFSLLRVSKITFVGPVLILIFNLLHCFSFLVDNDR